MSKLVVALFLALCAVSAYGDQSSFTAFQDYMRTYGKKYANIDELVDRYNNYRTNLERIALLNADGRNVYGINKFSDVSAAEFKQQYLGFDPTHNVPRDLHKARVVRLPSNITASTKVDWRTKGAITPVKDQAQCGSCWAFSATEEIESMWFLAGNALTQLSPQQIVSCDTSDWGCQGGWTTTAFNYVKNAGGIESNSNYPYTSGGGVTGTCKVKPTWAAKIKGYELATPLCQDSCNKQDENKMKTAMDTIGPISICVDAESWQLYSSGIITANCPHAYTNLDHCVQAVGYDATHNPPYWIIRNSWNTNWGEQGYIRVAIGSNLCGIADLATIVLA